VIARAMAKDPADRFGSATELATALQRTLDELESGEIEFARRIARSEVETDETELPRVEAVAAAGEAGPIDAEDTVLNQRPVAPPTAVARVSPAPSRRLLAAAVAAVVVLGVVAAVVLAGGGSAPKPGTGVGTTGARTTTTAPTRTTVKSAAAPIEKGALGVMTSMAAPAYQGPAAGIALVGSELWVADPVRGQIVGLVPEGRSDTVAVGGQPDGVVADSSGRLWITDPGAGQVTVYTPASHGARHVVVGSDPGPIAIGSGAAWVANAGGPSITRIDLRTLAPQPIPLLSKATAIVAAFKRVWIATASGSVIVLNQTDGKRNAIAGPRSSGTAVAGSSSYGVWLLHTASGAGAKLTRINPQSTSAISVAGGQVYAEPSNHVAIDGQPVDIVRAGHAKILISAGDVVELVGTHGHDDGRPLGTVTFGAPVGRLAVGKDFAWVDVPSIGKAYKLSF
jgi:hypothetical protein